MKKLLILLLMFSAAGILTAQNEAAARVIIDQIDDDDTGGNARATLTTQVWNTSRNNPRLKKKELIYSVIDNDTGEEYEVIEDSGVTGNSNRRATAVYISSNAAARAVTVAGTNIERRNRRQINGEDVDEDTDVLDLTALPPGDYTIKARNRRGKDKAELQIKIKGKKNKKKKKKK